MLRAGATSSEVTHATLAEVRKARHVSMEPALGQIAKIVFLMLENRSLDNVLGWLYHGEELPPDRIRPAGSGSRFDGLSFADRNFVDRMAFAPSYGTHHKTQPLRQPRWNPNEWWRNVGNQMYWDSSGHDAAPRWSATPPMTGFARDYWADYDRPDEVMGAYTSDQLPALYGLASSFAVSDRWFSSVPTETNPNRAFSLCGSSLGSVNNADTEFYDLPTIFNALAGASPRRSWGIFWQYDGTFDGDPVTDGQCFTVDVFPQIGQALDRGEGVVSDYGAFLQLLAAGDLPDFSYLEPFWGGGYGLPLGDDFVGLQGNDYHPPAWVGPAEYDLAGLYNSIRDSPHWDEMLFIVTFDEHGGTYDHVPPPRTVRPDDSPSRGDFDFRRLGARVPTLLVSPYVVPGTVFRAPSESIYDFDHTSFIATVLTWAGIDPTTADMGLRVANAPTFEHVLTTTPSLDAPHLVVPEDYRGLGGTKGLHNIDLPSGALPIAAFRGLLEAATSADDLRDRIRSLGRT